MSIYNLTNEANLYFSAKHQQFKANDPVNSMVGTNKPALYLTADNEVVPVTVTSKDQNYQEIISKFNDYRQIGAGGVCLAKDDGTLTPRGRAFAQNNGVDPTHENLLNFVDILLIGEVLGAGDEQQKPGQPDLHL